MDKTAYDWSGFSLRIGISADLTTIFNAWTSQEELEKWFLAKAAFYDSNGIARPRDAKIAKGDSYIWKWHVADDIEKGEILAMNESNALSFSFGVCHVFVSLTELAKETIVEIEQSNIPLDEASIVSLHLGCMQGWTFYLANLKSMLEGGIDLRNKNEKIKNVIST